MLGLAMNWRNIILCNFEFLKLSHSIRIFGIFLLLPPWTSPWPPVVFVGYIITVSKSGESERGEGDISGR
jgi:hypothetical protein